MPLRRVPAKVPALIFCHRHPARPPEGPALLLTAYAANESQLTQTRPKIPPGESPPISRRSAPGFSGQYPAALHTAVQIPVPAAPGSAGTAPPSPSDRSKGRFPWFPLSGPGPSPGRKTYRGQWPPPRLRWARRWPQPAPPGSPSSSCFYGFPLRSPAGSLYPSAGWWYTAGGCCGPPGRRWRSPATVLSPE